MKKATGRTSSVSVEKIYNNTTFHQRIPSPFTTLLKMRERSRTTHTYYNVIAKGCSSPILGIHNSFSLLICTLRSDFECGKKVVLQNRIFFLEISEFAEPFFSNLKKGEFIVQRVLALCYFWDLEKFALAKNRISKIFILCTQ